MYDDAEDEEGEGNEKGNNGHVNGAGDDQATVSVVIGRKLKLLMQLTVLRIRDIFVRIRIRGSVPPTNVSRSDSVVPAIFVSDLLDDNKKLKGFLGCHFEVIFTLFFKD